MHFRTKSPFPANQNDVIKYFAVLINAVIKRVDCSVVFPFLLETSTGLYCPAQRKSCFLGKNDENSWTHTPLSALV